MMYKTGICEITFTHFWVSKEYLCHRLLGLMSFQTVCRFNRPVDFQCVKEQLGYSLTNRFETWRLVNDETFVILEWNVPLIVGLRILLFCFLCVECKYILGQELVKEEVGCLEHSVVFMKCWRWPISALLKGGHLFLTHAGHSHRLLFRVLSPPLLSTHTHTKNTTQRSKT